MTINPARDAEFASIVRRMLAGMSRYKAVERMTGVPAAFIAVTHIRESSGNFNTYLGNGEPLNRVTRLVPKGRGPFATWEDGAVDALTLQGLAGRKDWTIPFLIFALEGYNGFGYRNKGIRSPYLWGGTNLQEPGKYVRDGVFDPNVMDTQPGAVALLQLLFTADPSLAVPLWDGDPVPTPAPTPPAIPAPSTEPGPLERLIQFILSVVTALFKSLKP